MISDLDRLGPDIFSTLRMKGYVLHGCHENSDPENSDLRPQTPKAQTPKTQTSKAQTPKTQTPKTQTPRNLKKRFKLVSVLITLMVLRS